MINWGDIKDLHIEGSTHLGKVYIRLNREQKVTGMYTMFGEVEKFIPKDDSEENVENAKNFLNKIFKNKIEKTILINKK